MAARETGWWCVKCGSRGQRTSTAVDDRYAVGVCLRGSDAKPPTKGCKGTVGLTPRPDEAERIRDIRARASALAHHPFHVATKRPNPICAKCQAAAVRTAAVGHGQERDQ